MSLAADLIALTLIIFGVSYAITGLIVIGCGIYWLIAGKDTP